MRGIRRSTASIALALRRPGSRALAAARLRPGRSARPSATPPAAGPAAVQPGLRRQVRPRERQARPRPDAGHVRRLGRLHARRPLPGQEGPRPPGLGDRPPLAGAREAPRCSQQALRGEVSLQQMFDHYLGWLANGGKPADHFQFLDGDDYPLRPPVGDGDRAERRPHRGAAGAGPGQEQALGRPRRPLAGRVADRRLRLVGLQRDPRLQGHRGHGPDRRRPDGQLRRVHRAPRPRRRSPSLESGSPFLDLLGLGIPEIAGIFGEIGGIYARARAERAGDDPPVASRCCRRRSTRRTRSPTRRCSGYAFDRDTSPDGAVAAPHQRRCAGAGRQPARLGRRRRDARPAARRDVRPGARQRDRVVLPAPAHDRHQRRQRAGPERRREPARAAAVPPAEGGHPALRAPDRPDQGQGPARGEQLHRAREDHEEGIQPDQRRPRAVPPGPAHGRDQAEQFFTTVTPFLRYKVFGDKKKAKKSEAEEARAKKKGKGEKK